MSKDGTDESKEQAPAPEAQDQKASGRNQSSSQVASNDLPSEYRHRSEPADQRSNEETKHPNYDRVIAWLTGVLAFVATLTLVVLVIHACLFYRTDETARIAQAAFVAVRDIEAAPIGELKMPNGVSGGMGYRLGMLWDNSGSTPTKELEIGHALAVTAFGESPSFPDDLLGSGSHLVILPHGTVEQGDVITGGTDLNAIRDGHQSMFITGYAKYQDVFDKRHVTLACYWIGAGPVDYTSAGASGIHAYQCEQYNCADDDCRQYGNEPALAPLIAWLDRK